MATGADAKPAILGGPAAITIAQPDRWNRIGEEEVELVAGMVRRGELSLAGSGIALEFEKAFADYIGVRHALGVCNGTSSLFSCFYGVKVGPGDEVITPSYTWFATFSSCILLGARPVFCEIDPDSLMIDPEDAKRRITPRTRAIVAVHLWGNVCDLDALLALSKETGLPVIEDCSHAHGAEWDGRKVGSFGAASGFSMQGYGGGAKPVSAGEGGVACTSDREVYERMLILGHFNRKGMADELTLPEYRPLGSAGLGFKLRPHAVAMALAKVQLERLPRLLESRRALVAKLDQALARLPGLAPLKVYPKARRGGFYGNYWAIYKPEDLGGLPRDRFLEAFRAEATAGTARAWIGSGGYPLCHLMPAYRDGFDVFCYGRGPLGEGYQGYREGDLPVTERAWQHTISLPIWNDPAPGAVEEYIAALEKLVRHHKELL
jgi:perosamine synthetase